MLRRPGRQRRRSTHLRVRGRAQALADQVRSSAARTPRYARPRLRPEGGPRRPPALRGPLGEVVQEAARAPDRRRRLSGALNVKCPPATAPTTATATPPRSTSAPTPSPTTAGASTTPGALAHPHELRTPGLFQPGGGAPVAGGGGAIRGLGEGPRAYRQDGVGGFMPEIKGKNVIAPKKSSPSRPSAEPRDVPRDADGLEDSGTVISSHGGVVISSHGGVQAANGTSDRSKRRAPRAARAPAPASASPPPTPLTGTGRLRRAHGPSGPYKPQVARRPFANPLCAALARRDAAPCCPRRPRRSAPLVLAGRPAFFPAARFVHSVSSWIGGAARR